ncbi:glycosyltransferase [Gramella sp. MT6]|uniref:glycosyltransferase family 2 protein n=1 Tax=Gramella sp. MT6 TaxID=2705471 RepID=UPI001C5E342E|nr:glycosyltransferase [Gramella sp. MT6]QYA25188.1 glycosyltransferase [Gramella sp. MT6]
MKLGILVTNYNTWKLTSNCVENCLIHADSKIDQFVIVDDCSSEVFENQFDHIHFIQNPSNLGLIKSLNRGLIEMKTDLILILDSDAWPLEKYIKKIKEYFIQNPAVGIATFQTENSEGKPSDSFEAEPGALSLILGQQLYRLYLKKFLKNPKEINVFTCAMVIRKEVLEDIGLFDENFDWLELDHDICMRASRKGWKIDIMPIRAFHKGSGTPQNVGHRVVRFYKNRWYLLRKFKKIRLENLTAYLISFRLGIEFVALWTIGALYYQDLEKVRDKAYSRRKMIKYFLLAKW